MRLTTYVALLVCALPALSQSNEIALQFGKVIGEGRRIRFQELPGEIFTEDGGYAGGIVYNRKLAGGGGGSVHFHLPVFVFENRAERLGNTSRVNGFVTPGVMLRLFDAFPLQPYGFVGVGYAHAARIVPDSSDEVRFDSSGTWGVSAGGGLDVMFGSRFGIRGEVRSLTSGGRDQVVSGILLDDPGTRWGATGGLVFRF